MANCDLGTMSPGAAALPLLTRSLRLRGGVAAATAAAAMPDVAIHAPVTQLGLYVGTLMSALSGCARAADAVPSLRRRRIAVIAMPYLAVCYVIHVPSVRSCISAGTKEMDLLGCIIVGLMTAAGGGTLRDVMLNRTPFWIHYPIHLHICIWISTVTFLIWPAIVARGFKDTHLAFLWSDALGMAASTVIGTHIGLLETNNWLIAVLSGLCTATFGGIGRDLLCQACSRATCPSARPSSHGLLRPDRRVVHACE